MKKNYILFLFVATLGLAISSCSNNDDDNSSIESTWEITHEGVIVNGKETLVPVDNEGGCEKGSITYLNNGTFTETYSEFNDDSKCVTFTENGTWSKKGNSLTLRYTNEEGDSYDAEGEIVELNKSTLKVKYTYTDPQGKVVEISVVVFKRK